VSKAAQLTFQEPWVERFRPVRLVDLVDQEGVKVGLLEFVRRGDLPHLLSMVLLVLVRLPLPLLLLGSFTVNHGVPMFLSLMQVMRGVLMLLGRRLRSSLGQWPPAQYHSN
jgi:replication factor C small subunit